MPATLRRSCTNCANSKTACDRSTPRCTRCVRRNCECIYANEPLTSGSSEFEVIQNERQTTTTIKPTIEVVRNVSPDVSDMSLFFEAHLLDPFDSYPATNLPRLRVQGLMRHFLSKIAFQYYPLDTNPASNPFVASWWPLALTDPLLFHVTLQTASLDDEYLVKKGFPHSELLMNDSVSLLRHKIQDQSLAFQDATMNAVITLAAIEHGKGNLHVSKMHIDGVKRMVNIRGGLTEIKRTSPLTTRMVPWVCMLVTGSPQFESQDDYGRGNGVCAVQQWQCDYPIGSFHHDLLDFGGLGIDHMLENTVTRVRSIFGAFQTTDNPVILSTTDLHDLTCFVLHRLLSLHPFTDSCSANISECLRYGSSIYMFLVHGPTYYSHASILHSLSLRLKHHLDSLVSPDTEDSLLLWLLSVGSAAAIRTSESRWFKERMTVQCANLGLRCWEDFKAHLKRVLWCERRPQGPFQQMWEEMNA